MISGGEKDRANKKNLRFTGMKRGIHILLLRVIVAMSLVSCSRGSGTGPDDDGPHIINNNDTVAPVVEIHTPVDAQVFASGAVINMTGKIMDDGGLYRGTIKITNDANGTVVKEQLYEIHGFQLYNFNLSHTSAVTVASNYTVTVTFEDHGLNQASKSVKIKVNP
jgi:hypothetical protein